MPLNFKSANPLAFYALTLAVALGASGLLSCATQPPFRVSREIPAEVNTRGKNEVAVTGFDKHRDGPTIAQKLKVEIDGAEKFKIVPRSRASLELRGEVEESGYSEHITRHEATCYDEYERVKGEDPPDKNRREYECTERRRHGKARVELHVDVINVEKREILKPKFASCEDSETTSSLKGGEGLTDSIVGLFKDSQTIPAKTSSKEPPGIDGGSMLELCQTSAIGKVSKALVPTTVWEWVPFKKDSGVPEFAEALEHLEIGSPEEYPDDWGEAIELLVAVLENPELKPSTRAKAYWNLGLAYSHAQSFDEAEEAFRAGRELAPDGGRDGQYGCIAVKKDCFRQQIRENNTRRKDYQESIRQESSGR